MAEGPVTVSAGHPFNPPHLIPLVELLGNEKTDPAAIDGAAAFMNPAAR